MVLPVLILLICVGATIYYSRVKSRQGIEPTINCGKSPSFAVLLTMYNSPDRYDMYENVVKKWLFETPCEIYIVDSHGTGFPTLQSQRLHVFSFRQNQPSPGKPNFFSNRWWWRISHLERDSILKAETHFRNDWSKYDLIFKITGKYFVPQFQDLVKNYVPKDTEIVLQYSTAIWGQNSEIVGSKPYLIVPIVSRIQKFTSYESVLWKIAFEKKYKISRLPSIHLENPVKRSDGGINKNL